MDVLTNKINLVLGGIVALFTYLLGEHWFLFVFFLLFNACDCVSRWIAAYVSGTESSKAALTGVVKKLGYWLLILVSFAISVVFIEFGSIIGVDLKFTEYLGWFVLATLTINEIRSILENLVEAGYNPPYVLVKGLDIVNKAIDGKIKIGDEGIETELLKPEHEIHAKGKAILQVEDVRSKSTTQGETET